MLASYFKKFGPIGHGEYVAIDDCDLGAASMIQRIRLSLSTTFGC